MATVLDVAKYILECCGEMTAMKLQKLVYYSQAWTLVWDEQTLFNEPIEAWANGAVVPALYATHKGEFKLFPATYGHGNSAHLTANEKENIDRVLEAYAHLTGQQLSDINHQEAPWLEARGGLPPMARSTNIITPAAIYEFHSGIFNG